MSTVEEHFAILRAMGPQSGGWLTDPFHLSAARFLGAHLDELEAAWAVAKAAPEALAFLESIEGSGYGGMSDYDCAVDSLRHALGARLPDSPSVSQDEPVLLSSIPQVGGDSSSRASPSAALHGATSDAEPSGPWRPIESCPKDGTPILVSVTYNLSDEEWATTQWVDGFTEEYPWLVFQDRIDIPFAPTHWMPLPEGPK